MVPVVSVIKMTWIKVVITPAADVSSATTAMTVFSKPCDADPLALLPGTQMFIDEV